MEEKISEYEFVARDIKKLKKPPYPPRKGYE